MTAFVHNNVMYHHDDSDFVTLGSPLASDLMAMDVNPILSPSAPRV